MTVPVRLDSFTACPAIWEALATWPPMLRLAAGGGIALQLGRGRGQNADFGFNPRLARNGQE